MRAAVLKRLSYTTLASRLRTKATCVVVEKGQEEVSALARWP
jgi:hypothetical protein